jgi:hypothetical protein
MLRALALSLILVFGLCGCATQSKKAQETIFEVSFYSEAERAAPFISLRGDRKLFVLRVRQSRENYNYDGKFYELTREEEADLKAKALAFFKSAEGAAAPCTNSLRISIALPMQGERKELCIVPGKNAAADALIGTVNETLSLEEQIIWK